MNRGREEVSEYAKLSQDLGFAAVGITMDTVRPVKIGDEVPLSTKDGKPRRGHAASPKDIEWMKQQVSLPVVIKGMMSAEDEDNTLTVFDDYDDIVDKACGAWNFFEQDPKRIASITTRAWATVNI